MDWKAKLEPSQEWLDKIRDEVKSSVLVKVGDCKWSAVTLKDMQFQINGTTVIIPQGTKFRSDDNGVARHTRKINNEQAGYVCSKLPEGSTPVCVHLVAVGSWVLCLLDFDAVKTMRLACPKGHFYRCDLGNELPIYLSLYYIAEACLHDGYLAKNLNVVVKRPERRMNTK